MATSYTERIRNLHRNIDTLEANITKYQESSSVLTPEMADELETLMRSVERLETAMTATDSHPDNVITKKVRGRPKKVVDDAASATASTTSSSRKRPELTEEQRKAIGERLKAGKAAAKAKKEAAAAGGIVDDGDEEDVTVSAAAEVVKMVRPPTLAATPALSAIIAADNAKSKVKSKSKKDSM